jgi:hypothetical protein
VGADALRRVHTKPHQMSRQASFEVIGCPSISRRLPTDVTLEQSFGFAVVADEGERG